MKNLPIKHKGARSELVATIWLLENGYEVFRNVSQHGPADIIAIKDNEILHLDVKGSFTRLSQKQIDLGILPLYVDENGKCVIERNPEAAARIEMQCGYCKNVFSSWRSSVKTQRFCSKRCRANASYHRRKMKNKAIDFIKEYSL